ncbi:tRNA (cytidine(34)-2'-O)-methyltransferase [Rickettsiales bacterium]|nr:tRNA (cytidine(34)-2'-O)-methyltransferase [Rickettsiales bacterium]
MPRIALYQPDIAQNLGTTLRTAACFGFDVDIIEPCGFPFDDKKFRRAGMDYIDNVKYIRHRSWESFLEENKNSRIILLSSKAIKPYSSIEYKNNDILLFGRESAGVPQDVSDACNELVTIPMKEGMRSLNVAVSVGIVVGEVARQIGI